MNGIVWHRNRNGRDKTQWNNTLGFHNCSAAELNFDFNKTDSGAGRFIFIVDHNSSATSDLSRFDYIIINVFIFYLLVRHCSHVSYSCAQRRTLCILRSPYTETDKTIIILCAEKYDSISQWQGKHILSSPYVVGCSSFLSEFHVKYSIMISFSWLILYFIFHVFILVQRIAAGADTQRTAHSGTHW